MSIRLLFALFLLGSTAVYHVGSRTNGATPSISLLYCLAGGMIFLCALYGTFFSTDQRYQYFFVISQIVIDTIFISLVIFVTGGYASVFPFLYLLVIIYASVFVCKNGSLIVATISAAQYTLLLYLQAMGVIDPSGYDLATSPGGFEAVQLFQKCGILTAACYAVALLAGYLSDQEKQSKAELQAMETHLGRVQNLAHIGEMASGLAHEIKNPLASISGAIQLLHSEMKGDSPGNKQLMNIVVRETARLSELVNNFLTFARPVVGNEKSVNLPRAVLQTVALFKKDNSFNRRIEVEFDSIPTAHINIDPLQLQQILWNLLLNSAESIEDRGRIHVAVRKRKNGQVQVEIADNGCGMDENTISSIFNPFFTTKSRGTGLGLSIVYRILETYGCRMDVKSEPSVGSVFTLYFKTADSV